MRTGQGHLVDTTMMFELRCVTFGVVYIKF